MARRKAKVRKVYSLPAAAKLVGLKFDRLQAAIAGGQLEVDCVLVKPSGAEAPCVSSGGLRAFRGWMLRRYGARTSTFHRDLVARLRSAAIPTA